MIVGGDIKGAAERAVTPLDSALWSAFAGARSDRGMVTAWLSLTLAQIPEARAGAVLEPDAGAGAFLPVAIAPDPRRDLAALRPAAEAAIASGRSATVPDEAAGVSRIAFPLRKGGDGPVGAIVLLEVQGTAPRVAQAALRTLHWAAGWIAARMWEREATRSAAAAARAGIALDILAAVADHRKLPAAAMAAVNEMQSVLACDQVALGMLKGARTAPRIRVLALSHAAWFKHRSSLVEGLEAAMEECFDQGESVGSPPAPGTERAIAVAHGDHLRRAGLRHMLTVPMHGPQGTVGAITLTRRQDRPFTAEERMTAESIAALLGPMLEMKRLNRRWIGGRLMDGTLHVLGVVLGPRRLSWKLLAIGLVALAVAAATVRGPFRVQADAVLRADLNRAAVAPFAGYVAAANVRAGDRVSAGDELARLDDTDLALEALRWRSEIDRLAAQGRAALAKFDREQVALTDAQIAQARAQARLAEEQLARTRILSPIDGVVVSGDLSQRLGAPVQLGEVLFEIAPLEAFRVDIWLDERDLRHVAAGQKGALSLTGRPADGLPFTVARVTPVAEAHEGVNTFRVEAWLDDPPPGLRPGMEGVARIEAGEALVAWTWTRRLVDWLRQTAWTWQP